MDLPCPLIPDLFDLGGGWMVLLGWTRLLGGASQPSLSRIGLRQMSWTSLDCFIIYWLNNMALLWRLAYPPERTDIGNDKLVGWGSVNILSCELEKAWCVSSHPLWLWGWNRSIIFPADGPSMTQKAFLDCHEVWPDSFRNGTKYLFKTMFFLLHGVRTIWVTVVLSAFQNAPTGLHPNL